MRKNFLALRTSQLGEWIPWKEGKDGRVGAGAGKWMKHPSEAPSGMACAVARAHSGCVLPWREPRAWPCSLASLPPRPGPQAWHSAWHTASILISLGIRLPICEIITSQG